VSQKTFIFLVLIKKHLYFFWCHNFFYNKDCCWCHKKKRIFIFLLYCWCYWNN